MAPLLTRRSASQQEALAATTALAVDLVTGLRVLRGIGAQDHAARRYAGASRHALDVTLRAATTKGLHLGLTTTVNGLFLATVAGVAGWLALQGRLTIGELVAVVGLAQFIAEPVQTLGYCVQLFAMARASAGRVARVLGAAPVLTPGDAGPPAPSPVPAHPRRGRYARPRRASACTSAPARSWACSPTTRATPRRWSRCWPAGCRRPDHRGTLHVDGVPADELHIDAAARRGPGRAA